MGFYSPYVVRYNIFHVSQLEIHKISHIYPSSRFEINSPSLLSEFASPSLARLLSSTDLATSICSIAWLKGLMRVFSCLLTRIDSVHSFSCSTCKMSLRTSIFDAWRLPIFLYLSSSLMAYVFSVHIIHDTCS